MTEPTAPLRVSLRWIDDGQARDLVGDLVLADEERIVVLPAGRGPVELPRASVLAMRRVPPRVVRPTSGVDDLGRLVAEGWPGTGQIRMGGWVLHTGQGYSRRANSCHVWGTPERATATAVDQVTEFYRGHGLAPCFQLASRDSSTAGAVEELDAFLASSGWQVRTPSSVLVRELGREPDNGDVRDLQWSEYPDADWLAVQGEDHPGRLAVLTSTSASYVTLYAEGEVLGAGRVVITRDWAGLSCLFVRPEHRGCGHGRALTIAMMARARESGASFGYLQVVDDNRSAGQLYESLGFRRHHGYHYRELVS